MEAFDWIEAIGLIAIVALLWNTQRSLREIEGLLDRINSRLLRIDGKS
jgi:hypothetical protein